MSDEKWPTFLAHAAKHAERARVVEQMLIALSKIGCRHPSVLQGTSVTWLRDDSKRVPYVDLQYAFNDELRLGGSHIPNTFSPTPEAVHAAVQALAEIAEEATS